MYVNRILYSTGCFKNSFQFTIGTNFWNTLYSPVVFNTHGKLLKKSERWPKKWSKVKTLGDKLRSGRPFFHKLCEKYYRKSCKYMLNNSTKQKGKKISISHYRSKFRPQRYGDNLPKKGGKPWREKGGAPFMQAWCQKDLPTKEDLPANSRDVNP